VRAARERTSASNPDASVHARFATHLVLVHRVLRRNIERISESAKHPDPVDAAVLADFTDLNLRFLQHHHEGEDQILFPALRRHNALRSSDGAFLEVRQAEHREVHRAMAGLATAADDLRRGHVGLGPLTRMANELRLMLTAHLDSEELGLNAEHLTQMIPAAALDATENEIVARERREGGPLLLMLMLHSLSDDERQALFGRLPWFVRKVLIAGFWRARYRRFVPLSFRRDYSL
jgi:hemerythrin-like domain-containing protein